MIKKSALIKTPVLITFFVRHWTFSKVFERICQVRPAILFLASDGPRENTTGDIEKINRCRQIAENIDWECEVHRLYSESNLGLLENTMRALEYAFSKVDRLIFLEDDILPSIGFFSYCDELLEKYKDDLRVHMVCGMNHVGKYSKTNFDYFFSQVGSIWGFALWKRTFDDFDFYLKLRNDYCSLRLLKENVNHNTYKIIHRTIEKEYLKISKQNIKCNNFELLAGISMYLSNSLLIVPKYNLITCLGISNDSANSPNNSKHLTKRIRKLFNMKSYELEFPLKHPKYFARDRSYELIVRKILGKNSLIRFIRKIEVYFRKKIYK